MCVRPANYQSIATSDEPDPQTNGPVRHHIYIVRDWHGIATNASNEHQEARWFSLDEPASLNLASGSYPEIFASCI
ncbi:NUDIX hydrolase [Pelagibius sp. Alg239-R121]|uniref:NUDIX hydrolase n=1 Tax=Pelagibius sp. Alg239-R121 TaxID=2993448 RepID=UPI00346011B6